MLFKVFDMGLQTCGYAGHLARYLNFNLKSIFDLKSDFKLGFKYQIHFQFEISAGVPDQISQANSPWYFDLTSFSTSTANSKSSYTPNIRGTLSIFTITR